MFRWLCWLGRHKPHVWFWMPGYVTQQVTYCERCGDSLETGGQTSSATRYLSRQRTW